MRILLSISGCFLVIVLAYWAYNENYKTQAAIRRVSVLQQKIGREREAIAMLSAEWAYLNRPDRLRDLVDLNFETLQLLPLTPQHFGDTELVAYPQPAEQNQPEPSEVTP